MNIDNSQTVGLINKACAVVAQTTYRYEFSICTLVTRKKEYAEMMASFVSHGFTHDSCEYLYVDNTQGCQYDAFRGLNLFLQRAQGKYIILCHQDILLHDHNRLDLSQRIRQLDSIDPKWGILGNAGGINLKWVAMHVTQKSGKRLKEELLPLKTMTVDENFMLVKNDANLAFSSNLAGFHMYGTDMCLIADVLGYSAYVIDFNLLHKSDGNADESFYSLKRALIKKYHKAFQSRFISTTITRFYISGSCWGNLLGNSSIILFFARQYYKFFKGKRKYHKV